MALHLLRGAAAPHTTMRSALLVRSAARPVRACAPTRGLQTSSLLRSEAAQSDRDGSNAKAGAGSSAESQPPLQDRHSPSMATKSGARPRILNASPPPYEEQDEETRKHNEDMERRKDRPMLKARNEDARWDKVPGGKEGKSAFLLASL